MRKSRKSNSLRATDLHLDFPNLDACYDFEVV